jgi:hypothetical protein
MGVVIHNVFRPDCISIHERGYECRGITFRGTLFSRAVKRLVFQETFHFPVLRDDRRGKRPPLAISVQWDIQRTACGAAEPDASFLVLTDEDIGFQRPARSGWVCRKPWFYQEVCNVARAERKNIAHVQDILVCKIVVHIRFSFLKETSEIVAPNIW